MILKCLIESNSSTSQIQISLNRVGRIAFDCDSTKKLKYIIQSLTIKSYLKNLHGLPMKCVLFYENQYYVLSDT